MKSKPILLSICMAFLLGCTNEKDIKLPLTEKYGYGPFNSSFQGISFYSEDGNSPWKKTHLKVSGIPEDWTDLKTGDISTDVYQSAYQEYYRGNISKEHFEELQKSWNWTIDSSNLSEKPLKCKIAFAIGKNSSGELKMIVDSNNNLDFKDDDIFKPIEITPGKKINLDSLALTSAMEVTTERFLNDKITKVNVPLLIVYLSQNNMFMCNFPQYATAKLNGEEIAVRSDEFMNLSYKYPDITKTGGRTNEGKKANNEKFIAKNEYIEIGNSIYKNQGVRKNENVLVLKKLDVSKDELVSTQIGFKPFDISGNDFKTNTSISLDDLKGKFVLLDFWATWCAPCIKEMPNLSDLYRKTDKSKFEIIGIVGDSPVEDLDKIIEKFAISWPQVVSNDLNDIIEEYGVNGYPTSFLVNPEGVIIAKNLRGKELENKIQHLIETK